MATDHLPNALPSAQPELQPFQAWFARLGLSGKLLAIGGLVGFIAVFFPLISMSVQMPNVPASKNTISITGISTSQSIMVVRDFRGVLCLLGYVGVIALSYVLYRPNGLANKQVYWAGLGVGGFIALLALWLFVAALNGSGMMGFGFGFQVSVGIGAIVNVLAAGAVAAGGFLKAREEKLF
jgi:uncharacterized membrane protein